MITRGWPIRCADRLAAVVLVTMLAACSSAPPAPVTDRSGTATQIEKSGKAKAAVPPPVSEGPTYVVKKGDTLYAIALDQGQDYRDLAQWNNLDNPNRLLVGQSLRLSAPPAPAAADTGVQIKPITSSTPVTLKPADDAALVKPVTGSAPTLAPADSSTLKRGPKGGSQPYSDEALARQKELDAVYDKDKARPGTAKVTEAAPAATPASAASIPAATSPSPAQTSASPATPASPATAPAATAVVPAAATLTWTWPVPGKVLTPFSEGTNKGIDLAGKTGEPVLAAAAGKVSYVGSSLRGYGKMVVLKHGSDYLSVYAHNNQVLVSEGQSVTAGQKIAELGSTDTDSPKLHFEIRRQGKPIDPLSLLPPR